MSFNLHNYNCIYMQMVIKQTVWCTDFCNAVYGKLKPAVLFTLVHLKQKIYRWKITLSEALMRYQYSVIIYGLSCLIYMTAYFEPTPPTHSVILWINFIGWYQNLLIFPSTKHFNTQVIYRSTFTYFQRITLMKKV